MDTVSHRWQSPSRSTLTQTSPLAFLPGSRDISALPNEILSLIFSEGCEIDNSLQRAVFWRMRYPLISVVRRVCIKWKKIADSENKFNKQHFWFTFLRLSPPFGPFIHQVEQFEQALTKSQDCDLCIELSLLWTREAKDLPSADADLLNLFIRAIDSLVRYQQQITIFRIDVSQTQFLGHLLHLFATRLNYMARCPLVVFKKPPPPLSDITSKQAITPPNPDTCVNIHCATNSSRLLPRVSDVSFVRNTRWDLSWMNGGLMKFPFFITHLEIPELDLHENYEFFDTIRSELMSLAITSSRKRQDLNITWDTTLQPPLNTINFVKLWRLRMNDPSSGSGWADHFFKNVSCPRLEVVEIIGINNPPVSSSVDTFNPTMQIPGFPRLQRLTIKNFDVSQNSLSCLARFASSSIQELSIESLSFKGCKGSKRQRITDVLMEVLRHTHPLKISLVQSYRCKVSLLEILNLSMVQELTINELHGNGKLLLISGHAKTKVPLLLKLKIRAGHISPRILLERFECVSLTTLVLEIDNRSSDGGNLKDTAKSLFTTFCTPIFQDELIFPALKSLHLKVLTRNGPLKHEIKGTSQIVNDLLARRHQWNGATLLKLQRIRSGESCLDRKVISVSSKSPDFRFAYWEHEVIASTAVPQ